MLRKPVLQLCPRNFSTLIRIVVASLLLLALSPAPAPAKSRVSPPPVDQDYVVALAAADCFLHAWQTEDEEAGILMLTDRLKQRSSEDAVHDFFTGPESKRTSYEIGRGRKLSAGRYEFPVALFLSPSQNGPRWTRPQASALIVVRSGRADWAIDRLP